MKDSLGNFIDNNREAFDDRTPSEQVWSSIDKSLPVMKKVSLWNHVGVWRSAAMVLLALSVYLIASKPGPALAKKENTTAQREFTDLESFYSNQINEKVAMINNLETTDDDDQFTQDFRKLEAMYQVLKEEMKSHPGEKVRDAMVLNFLVQIDLLNQQIKRLEDQKNPKSKSKTAEV